MNRFRKPAGKRFLRPVKPKPKGPKHQVIIGQMADGRLVMKTQGWTDVVFVNLVNEGLMQSALLPDVPPDLRYQYNDLSDLPSAKRQAMESDREDDGEER